MAQAALVEPEVAPPIADRIALEARPRRSRQSWWIG